jgi:hypothetical protein
VQRDQDISSPHLRGERVASTETLLEGMVADERIWAYEDVSKQQVGNNTTEEVTQ